MRGGTASDSTPHCNTGCTFRKSLEIKGKEKKDNCDLSWSWDWYQATLGQEVEPLQALRWAEPLGDCNKTNALHGYQNRYDYGVAAVLSGGASGKHGVHIQVNGGDVCGSLVDSLREKFPDHRPSRVDVCIDFQGADAWDALKDLVMQAADMFGQPTGTAGDWFGQKRGRTLYVNPRRKGKEAPAYSARLYEKGHQLRELGINPDAPLDWVRLEFEIHPPKHTRHLVASMTPDQVARASRWMRWICEMLGTVHAERVRLSTRRKRPPVVDAIETMFRQYTGTITELKRDVWMTREEWQNACMDLWDRETFQGISSEILREWYF